MKVTFCTYDAPTFVGGPNSWLRNLLPALRQLGIESEILFFISGTSLDCPCFAALSRQGFSCHAFSWHATTQQKVRWILSQLRSNPPDVFVPNLILAALYASCWIKRSGIPTIGILHSDDDFYQGVLQEFVFGQEAYQLSALVCVSEFLAQSVIVSGKTNVSIRRIPCGVSLPNIEVQKSTDKLRIIYTGRLVEEQKQISKVASALCRAVREIPNTEAYIYGDGPAKESVQAILEHEGKGLPIYLGGLVDHSKIQSVLVKAHVSVLLSDYEGLPVSLLEAMAYGVVPVCLNIRSGIPELVEHEVTGLLVEDREDEFIAAIQRLHNLDFWHQQSRSARHKIETAYSNTACVLAWKELLLDLHQRSTVRKTIPLPLWLRLPPVNPAFAEFETRISPTASKLLNTPRRYASFLKQHSIKFSKVLNAILSRKFQRLGG